MAVLSTRPVLGTPPADDDYIHIVDRSDLTGSPQGTSFQQNVSVNRTHGDGQNTTFDNVATLGSDGAVLGMNFISPAVFFSIRNNVSADIFTVTETGNVVVQIGNLSITTGDININTGDLIVQNGNIDVQNGDVDCNEINFDGNITASGNLNMQLNGVTQLIDNNGVAPFQITSSPGIVLSGTVDLVNNGLFRVSSIQSTSSAVDPTIAEVPAGHSVVHRNTALAETRTWYNNAGAMISSAAFT